MLILYKVIVMLASRYILFYNGLYLRAANVRPDHSFHIIFSKFFLKIAKGHKNDANFATSKFKRIST